MDRHTEQLPEIDLHPEMEFGVHRQWDEVSFPAIGAFDLVLHFLGQSQEMDDPVIGSKVTSPQISVKKVTIEDREPTGRSPVPQDLSTNTDVKSFFRIGHPLGAKAAIGNDEFES